MSKGILHHSLSLPVSFLLPYTLPRLPSQCVMLSAKNQYSLLFPDLFLDICMSSLEKRLVRSSAQFLIELFASILVSVPRKTLVYGLLSFNTLIFSETYIISPSNI